MADFSNIVISGRLTEDARLNTTGKGTSVLSFTVANSVGFGDSKTTTFYKCAMFDARADKLVEYLQKGKSVIVSGEPSLRKTTRDDGRMFADVNIRVSEITLLASGQKQQETSADVSTLTDAGFTAENDENVPF